MPKGLLRRASVMVVEMAPSLDIWGWLGLAKRETDSESTIVAGKVVGLATWSKEMREEGGGRENEKEKRKRA